MISELGAWLNGAEYCGDKVVARVDGRLGRGAVRLRQAKQRIYTASLETGF